MRIRTVRRSSPSFATRRPTRAGNATSLSLVLLALLVIAAVVTGVAWMSLIRNPSQAYLEQSQEQFIRLTGLGAPVSNAMDPRYTDRDGDLIADPPSDAARLFDPPVLFFSYVSVEDPAPFREAFAGLMEELSRATGRRVEYAAFESTEQQLLALRDGALHVTGFNTGGVPIAVNAAGFVPVSLLAGDDNRGLHKMQIVARAASPVRAVADLKGRELALTDASSNSGYKAPLVLLKDFNLQPGRDYGIRYSGGQDQSIDGLVNGQFEVIAVASDVLRRAVAAGRLKESDFRVIHESGEFPTAAMGFAHSLRPEIAAKVRDVLLNHNWGSGPMAAYFAGAGQNRFVAADYRKDWELVRRIDNEIGFAHRLPEPQPATQPAPDESPATRPGE